MSDPTITCGACGFTSSAIERECPACGAPRSAATAAGGAPQAPATGDRPGVAAWAPTAPTSPSAPTDAVRSAPVAVGPSPTAATLRGVASMSDKAARSGTGRAAPAAAPPPPFGDQGPAVTSRPNPLPGASVSGEGWRPPPGVSTAEMARRFARAEKRSRRKPPAAARTIVTIVVALFVLSQWWGCLRLGCEVDDQSYETSWDRPGAVAGQTTTGSDSGGEPASITTDAGAELRALLDDLMAVTQSLPDQLDEPSSGESRQAAAAAKKIRAWIATYRDGDATRRELRLATAAARYGETLSRYLVVLDMESYARVLTAWNAWDELDDSWHSE